MCLNRKFSTGWINEKCAKQMVCWRAVFIDAQCQILDTVHRSNWFFATGNAVSIGGLKRSNFVVVFVVRALEVPKV